MKVWASASAIGLSLAYFAAGCSSEPPSDGTYVPPAGGSSSTAGSGTGGSGTSGSGTTGGSTSGGDSSMAGTGTTAGTGTGGSAGAGGSGTAGGSGGTGGSAPAADCPAGVSGHCKAGDYPKYEGYTLNLVEEFDAPLDLNTDPIWTWSDGSPQDGQTRFREEAITFKDGNMEITADVKAGCAPKTTNAACLEPYPSHGEAFDPNPTKQIVPMGVWSGELRTKYNNYRYGRYEVKLAAPTANPAMPNTTDKAGGASGNFLSTMFIFRTPKNLDWNEIDIELEPWGTTSVFGNVVNAKGATGYPGGNAAPWDVAGPGAGFKIYDSHVYAFTWTPNKIEWFVDGTSVKTFAGTQAVPIPNLAAKIMMNLWIFSGPTFGDAANNKYPFTAKYDWFRFYKLDTETTYPCTGTPGCLPAADKTKSSQNNPKEANYGG